MKLRSIVCFLSARCNYKCPYCGWRSQEKEYPERPWQDWAIMIGKFPDPLTIDLTGGEPFIYPGLADLLSAIPTRHRVAITTNTSCVDYSLLPRFCHITMSYHPSMEDSRQHFFDNAAKIKVSNSNLTINVVAHPSQTALLPDIAEHCRRLGIKLHVEKCGGIEYTPEEWEAASKWVSPDRIFPFALPVLCSAGISYRMIMADGRSRPCFARPFDINMLDGEEVPDTDPILCKAPVCAGCDFDASEMRSLDGKLLKSGK